jgi:hypothetical protein
MYPWISFPYPETWQGIKIALISVSLDQYALYYLPFVAVVAGCLIGSLFSLAVGWLRSLSK